MQCCSRLNSIFQFFVLKIDTCDVIQCLEISDAVIQESDDCYVMSAGPAVYDPGKPA